MKQAMRIELDWSWFFGKLRRSRKQPRWVLDRVVQDRDSMPHGLPLLDQALIKAGHAPGSKGPNRTDQNDVLQSRTAWTR